MRADLSIIENQIFTQVKNYVLAQVGTAYSMSDENFSTISKSRTDAVFPFVYFSLASAYEIGTDLERDKLNGGTYTFQIDVFDNVSPTKSKKVMDCVQTAMKNMAFTVTSMPYFEVTDSIYRETARFRRNIADGDML